MGIIPLKFQSGHLKKYPFALHVVIAQKKIGQIDNWGYYFDDYIDTNKQN